jgi:betaine lipid synthase
MAWALCRVMLPLFGLGFIRRELIKGTDKDTLHDMIVSCAYPVRFMAWLFDNIFLRAGCCFAGVPERQMELGLHRHNNMALIIERVLFGTDLVNDNYFYAGYFLGYYTKQNCPRYLREEHFADMKKYLKAGKLVLVHGTLNQAIEESTVPITVASLLDHMDWMTDRMISEEMTTLMKKMDHTRGKVFWRTFSDEVHSSVLNWLDPVKVNDDDDRVGMYWTTWIAELKNCPIAYEDRVVTSQNPGLIKNLFTAFQIGTFPLWKPLVSASLSVTGHAKDMESFYKYQKEGYDAFRENMLHARPLLMEAFPLRKGGGMVWVDIGGGTARNLEYFTKELILKYFKKIVIVDISSSLLEIAQRRINAMGLQDIATVVLHDVTQDSMFDHLPKAGTVDVVTMSYSYSMIPDQKAALDNATKLCKKGGFVGVADFFLNGMHDEVVILIDALFGAF